MASRNRSSDLRAVRAAPSAPPRPTPAQQEHAGQPAVRAAEGGGSGPRPFFSAPPKAGVGGRRLLLLSYTFPPDESIGALRWQKMSRHFAERGWSLDVVMLDPAQIQSGDAGRLAELPPGTRLFGVPEGELRVQRVQRVLLGLYRRIRPPRAQATRPQSFHREEFKSPVSGRAALRRAYLAWLFYAKQGRWARDAAALALRVIEPGVHEAVITSGPPHMAHEAGRVVARRARLPLVIDLRDPWSLRHRLDADIASPVAFRLADRYEGRAVAAADLVVLNTELFTRGMREKYPAARDRMLTVMNGPDDETLPPPRTPRRFTIGFAGTIYVDRDPRTLLRAARRVVDELGLTPEDLGLAFIGNVDGPGRPTVAQMAAEEGIAPFVTVGGPRSRREALDFLAGAQLLVSLPQDGTMQIPAKIYEYMNFPAWLLVFGEPGSAPDLLLEDVPDADHVALDDVDHAASVIRARYLQYRRGERPAPVNADGRFSRKNQAKVLLEAIERVVGRRVRGAQGGVRAPPYTRAGIPSSIHSHVRRSPSANVTSGS
jgi:glycosyltransferase involved in cell wall biosynthesis